MERSGTRGRKLGARVPASGLQQWKLQAPGKETDTDRGTGKAKQSEREQETEAEIQKSRQRESKSNRKLGTKNEKQ